MLEYKSDMTAEERKKFEDDLQEEFSEHLKDTEQDLQFRLNGVSFTKSSGKQFAGYSTLEKFYRGDQWDHDEPPGSSQRTDNYCAQIVDTFSSLMYDAPVEVNCASFDPTDDILEIKAEAKEKLIIRVYEDNDADEIVFPEFAKTGSLYGDGFIKGPLIDKNGSEKKDDWKIVFYNVENPSNIRPIFMDENYQKLYGFIDTVSVTPMWVEKNYKKQLQDKGIDVNKFIRSHAQRLSAKKAAIGLRTSMSHQKFLNKNEYWTDKVMAIFIEDKLVDWYWHDFGFVPLEYVKNIHSPNHPYGKSDLEDALDPQQFYTRVNNDLANALKFLSTITLKGKNLDGMEVLVHGLSKIFNMPEDGEMDAIGRSGDPYASGNFADSRRRAILDVTGLSEALLGSPGITSMSGRAMSLALQSVVRKLNPRIKRHQRALRSLNANILRLYEKFWPETKEVIMGDYTSKVSIISTLLRNIIDELNKFQSGIQSLTTTQKNIGIPQPKIEQKLIKHDLADPVLGPQIARQPGLLGTQIQNDMGEPGTPGSNGEQGLPSAPNQAGTQAAPGGAVAATNQQASAAPVPQIIP